MKSLPHEPGTGAPRPQLIAATAHSLPEQDQALVRARSFAEPLISSEVLDTGENKIGRASCRERV